MKNILGATFLLFAAALELAPLGLAAQEQVTELRARHAEGQTILTWKEVDPPVKQDTIAIGPFGTLRDTMDASKKIRYRLYRSKKPISSVEGLEPIAEARPLTCWNAGYHRFVNPPEEPALRYVIEEGQKPVPPGTGIHAHNPSEAGEAWYAVTISINDRENKALGAGNALKSPVKEGVGPGPLVLQRIEKSEHTNNSPVTLHYYVRWESPPNSNVPSQPYDYVVMVPPNVAKPAPVGITLHGLDGNLVNYALGILWMNFDKGAILIATNDMDTDWWTGHHEFHGTEKPLQTKEDYQKGVVRPYAQKRLVSFLDAVAKKWDVDLNRTFVQGISMGGSGAPMLAIRYPERLAWGVSWVGVHIPAKMPEGYKSYYEMIWGKPEYGVKFEDGTPVWDYYNDAEYLRKHPEKEIGFLICGNGKNDEGIGWAQALEFFRALQETRRPHLFSWAQGGHSTQADLPMDAEGQVMSIDIRIDRSLPAFTRCSLDDNPGNGDPANGAPEGQANKYLYWETTGTADEPARWEMTVALTAGAPKDACTVDVTPRRCQKFKAKAGDRFKWTNASTGENKQIQSGEAVADKAGLVTLEKVTVTKGKNRLAIFK